MIPSGDVDQFQVPRLQPQPPLQRIPDMDISEHPQYVNRRLPDPREAQQQQALPMTPMHDAPPPQQSPLESPVYGQNVDLPHYELMIVNALTAINDPNGSPPKIIWEWMNRCDLEKWRLIIVTTHAIRNSALPPHKLFRKPSRRADY